MPMPDLTLPIEKIGVYSVDDVVCLASFLLRTILLFSFLQDSIHPSLCPPSLQLTRELERYR